MTDAQRLQSMSASCSGQAVFEGDIIAMLAVSRLSLRLEYVKSVGLKSTNLAVHCCICICNILPGILIRSSYWCIRLSILRMCRKAVSNWCDVVKSF